MAIAIIMPKQGQTVESCIIAAWKKDLGESVAIGDILCEVETDKALVEVESAAAGVLLAQFFQVGDDVPVLTPIAAIGAPGEDFSALRPTSSPLPLETVARSPNRDERSTITAPEASSRHPAISPRARHLASRKGVDATDLHGSGPYGRIIERDVLAALTAKPRLTPLAESMVSSGDYVAPERGTGFGGRVTTRDLQPAASTPEMPSAESLVDVQAISLKGTRKIIAARMLHSMQTTAQLTLNTSADARALLALRQRVKSSGASLGLKGVTVNDLLLFAVSRTLPAYPELNALFQDETLYQHRRVHLGIAVDTPRGLLVPVIRDAATLSLKQLSQEARRLIDACKTGKILPDELNGGSFTVSNLGSFGIESFTPILNPPQVGILGVGNINLKPIDIDSSVQFIPHISLSLTINHQVVDGAPAARFLAALGRHLAAIDLLLAF